MNEVLLTKNSLNITDEEFNKISSLILNKTGINLPESKKTLVISRLQKLVRELGFINFSEYYDYVIRDKSGAALSILATKISTNYTYFYRESKHFEFFQNIALPEITKILQSRNSKNLRIWCAGCSSGEEPYMLAMLMMEYFGINYRDWDAGVLATDISLEMLKKANAATYPLDSIANVPNNIKNKYFKQIDKDKVGVIDTVKREVMIRRYNLMNKVPPFKNKFQIIFCRNVMIYFNLETRIGVINRFVDLLEYGGYLFIGHSEVIDKSVGRLEYVQPAVYRRAKD